MLQSLSFRDAVVSWPTRPTEVNGWGGHPYRFRCIVRHAGGNNAQATVLDSGERHATPADTDPTDPRKGSLPEITDAGAMGVVMQLGVGTDGIRARWLSTSDANPWQQLTKAGNFKGRAQSYKVSEGIWELNIRGDAQVEDFAVFALMVVLGFAVLV